jgi:hypothetical protein
MMTQRESRFRLFDVTLTRDSIAAHHAAARRKAGAVELIQKPFSDETNLAVIHSALLGRDQELAWQSMMWQSQYFMIYMRVSQSLAIVSLHRRSTRAPCSRFASDGVD